MITAEPARRLWFAFAALAYVAPAVAGPALAQGPGAPRKVEPAVLRDAVPAPVEQGDLAPVTADDGLPMELWRGVSIEQLEKLLSEIDIPPRSAALHDLWTRLITSKAGTPSGEAAAAKFAALRLEALYRSGLAAEAAAQAAREPQGPDATLAVLAARNELANANRDKACELVRQATPLKSGMPKRVRAEALLLGGYCAAAGGDKPGAGLAAELAREEGHDNSPGLAALDAISIGARPQIKLEGRLALLDYRLMEMGGAVPPPSALEAAEPALLVALSNDAASEPVLRLAAAEAAARLNALAPDALAALYSALGPAGSAASLLGQTATSSPLRRAALFKAAESERTPMTRTRLIRALIDDARRTTLAFPVMRLLARATLQVQPQQELSWFIETATEIALASGKYDMARRWIALSEPAGPNGASFTHWLALSDIADPAQQPKGQYLLELEALALRSRFTPDALHRLATVLDALDYMVPIPLWEAASRTPQPAGGHLPETGVLSQLQDAAKKREFGHTVLLVMKALGPNGAEGAHMIALGDSIRALKRAGLESDARRLGLEALFSAWPRTAAN